MSRKNSKASLMLELHNLEIAATKYEYEEGIYDCPLGEAYEYPRWCTIQSSYDAYNNEYDADCEGCLNNCSCRMQAAMDVFFREGRKYRSLKKKADILCVLNEMRDVCDYDKILKYLPNEGYWKNGVLVLPKYYGETTC